MKKVRHLRNWLLRDSGTVRVDMTVVSYRVSRTEVQYKVSYCSPNDTFIKRVGVQVAESSDRLYTVNVAEDSTYLDINFAILTNMIKHRKDAPRVHCEYLEELLHEVVFCFN